MYRFLSFLTTKRILLALVLLLAALGLYGYLVSERLEREGLETRAVITNVYSREETRTRRGTARRPRYEKVTVHYLDYRFSVGGRDYEETRVRRYDNLMTARPGDSLLVRYLPDNPDVSRPVRREEGGYCLWRPRRARPAPRAGR